MQASRLAVILPLLAACGGSSPEPVPQAPVAVAGGDQAVASGALVTLDGSASSDPTGLALSYQWAQSSGPQVALTAATEARATFTAPSVPAGQPPVSLAFSLQVSTVHGSSTAAATVIVNPAGTPNPPPIANAGPSQAVQSGAQATLDGSGSGDPDGQTISYAWTQLSGASVTLSGSDTAHPTFTAPTVASGSPPVTLVFSLVVTDASATSAPSTATITVNPVGSTNPPPPGTPPPALPDPNPIPVGGSGSHRFEMGTDLGTGGLTVVDPAAGEPTVEGFVVVTFGSSIGPAPADAVVTVNGVPMKRLPPPSSGLFWQLDPAGPQPKVGSGGQLVLVATATDPQGGKQIQRTLVLPCPADIPVTLAPAPGSPLAPGTSVHLTSSANLLVNIASPLFSPYGPKATLYGYEPATRALVGYGSPLPFGTPNGFDVDVPVCGGASTGSCAATTAGAYLLELRWPGQGVLDGQSGGFCGLAKRFMFTK